MTRRTLSRCFHDLTHIRRTSAGQPIFSEYWITDGQCYHSAVDDLHPIPKLKYRVINETEPRPSNYSKRGFGPAEPYEQSVYWTLVNSTGYFADLQSNTGSPWSPSSDVSSDCWRQAWTSTSQLSTATQPLMWQNPRTWCDGFIVTSHT